MRLSAPSTAGAASGHTFFNSGCSGHFTRECTAPKKTTTQGHITPPPRGPQKVAVAKTGRVNYTTLEDVPEGEQVLAGMFALNGHLIIILFDSGATHDFISRACAQKHHLGIQYSDSPYMISTPGGRMATKHIVPKTPLNLGGRVFKVCLIVLDGQGIDVILGMGWMKRHKTLLNTAA
jgi:predicted aspartyl protease